MYYTKRINLDSLKLMASKRLTASEYSAKETLLDSFVHPHPVSEGQKKKLTQRGPGKDAATWVQINKGKRNVAGPQIRRFRIEKKIRQIDLMAKVATYGIVMTQSSLAKIETQQRALFDYELSAFARALGVTTAELVS